VVPETVAVPRFSPVVASVKVAVPVGLTPFPDPETDRKMPTSWPGRTVPRLVVSEAVLAARVTLMATLLESPDAKVASPA
jgi:hypothetical protein